MDNNKELGLIYQQIPKVMADIGAVTKSRTNSQQGYNFRGIDDVYNVIHSILHKYKIFTTPEVLSVERDERTSSKGGYLMYSIIKMKFTFYAEDGSSVYAITVGEAMDSGDKASNKAMAVAHKYALVQTFCIPTIEDKDPENDSPDPLPDPSLNKKDVKPITPSGDSKGGSGVNNYIVKSFGLYKGKTLSEIGVNGVTDLCKKIEADGKRIDPSTGKAKGLNTFQQSDLKEATDFIRMMK